MPKVSEAKFGPNHDQNILLERTGRLKLAGSIASTYDLFHYGVSSIKFRFTWDSDYINTGIIYAFDGVDFY